jgi:hypothetical protein
MMPVRLWRGEQGEDSVVVPCSQKVGKERTQALAIPVPALRRRRVRVEPQVLLVEEILPAYAENLAGPDSLLPSSGQLSALPGERDAVNGFRLCGTAIAGLAVRNDHLARSPSSLADEVICSRGERIFVIRMRYYDQELATRRLPI